MANQIITGGGKNEITLNNDGANYELDNGENILKGLKLYLKNNYTNKNETFYDEVISAVSCSNIIDTAISSFKKSYVDPKIETIRQEIINESRPTISFDIGFIRYNEFQVADWDVDRCGDEYVSGHHTAYDALYGIKNLSITGNHSISGGDYTKWTSSSDYWNGWISISIPASQTITVYVDNTQLIFQIGTAFSMAGNRGNMNTGWYKHYSVQVHI